MDKAKREINVSQRFEDVSISSSAAPFLREEGFVMPPAYRDALDDEATNMLFRFGAFLRRVRSEDGVVDP